MDKKTQMLFFQDKNYSCLYAKKWEKHGFKIFIGNQSDPIFWRDFFEKVGNVDVVIDDGGHTNKQQVFTLLETIPNINDNGML